MLSIHLQQLQFRAFHGLYEAEKRNGNDFLVDIIVQYNPAHTVLQIEQTINYVAVFELVKKRMSIATELLETVAMETAQQILEEFSLAETVQVSIKKLNPPIPDFNGTVGVSFEMKR